MFSRSSKQQWRKKMDTRYVIRADGGGEFTSKVFQEFCEANGIRHLMIVLKFPQ